MRQNDYKKQIVNIVERFTLLECAFHGQVHDKLRKLNRIHYFQKKGLLLPSQEIIILIN
jgi:hypothetical protein